MLTQRELDVTRLGEGRIPSPLALARPEGHPKGYVSDAARVAVDIESVEGEPAREPLYLQKAGPRERIFFDPARLKVGIVTCGGLCPGINNVVRSIVLELHHKYGVRAQLGFRYGFEGLSPAAGLAPVPLGPEEVRSIHRGGGSMLGLSRAQVDPEQMVLTLERHDIGLLFAIGGDGTLRGAHAIHRELARRGLGIGVVGVPKTIDNDIAFVDKTFGYDTAVELARLAVDAGHTEAIGARNGVCVVKLMGRDAGFVAAAATLASHDVNFCLVPEAPFDMDGPRGLLAALETRLRDRSHALIVVAEGCAARVAGTRDKASAHLDVGTHLRDAIVARFAGSGLSVTVKYIDPSYMIRSVPANASDSVFCDALARNAVHAGMAGKTDLVIGRWHRVFTHVPLDVATRERKRIDPDGALWLDVLETTGQSSLVNDAT